MNVQKKISLRQYNTFGIEAHAKLFVELSSMEELRIFLSDKNFKNELKLVLGGGSNILFTKDFDGVVIKDNIKGIEIVREDEQFAYVKAGAGEIWHDLVLFCLKKNFGGIENLSLIPGCVGAAPMQNIGAYGSELKDTFHELEAIKIENGEQIIFKKEECKFGYRESIFKNEAKGKFIVVNITLQLSKNPVFNTGYGAIKDELNKMGVQELNIRKISEAVCNIRRSKLPDPSVIGNAGSFFKNPVVTKEKFERLKNNFPEIVGYPSKNNSVKLAAGWLIEQCGWKGKRIGDAGVHEKQALVIVNYGNARGNEILQLAIQIKKSVKEKYDVDLETEVNIV